MNQNQSKTKIGPYIKSSAAYGLIMGAIVWIFAAIFGPIYCCSGLDINLFTGFVIGEVLAIIIGLLVAVSCSIIKGMNCPKKFLNDTTLDIALADGRVEQFAVYEPKVWAARINERYRLLQQMPKDA